MTPRAFHIAVMALGGQGGGVLVDWIVDLAEHAGWTAQSTSVAGVAQRTGATIYYIELVEPTPGLEPVMAQMAVPGDVDIAIAAELMEAGRALDRGLVTRDRTTLIASTHRTYAVQEKTVPGNGIADSAGVIEHLRRQSGRLIAADLQALAQRHGSVISASLFGALAGSRALPFDLSAFEAVVERSGVGVKASLGALRDAAALAHDCSPATAVPVPGSSVETPPRALPQAAASPALQPLLVRIRNHFPAAAQDWLGEGLARVVDWQDIAYGEEYLDRVERFARQDSPVHAYALTIEAARWIAVAMSYDDIIRVADLKTRPERSQRIRGEVAATDDDIVGTEEYFHPRIDEVQGLLPIRWADRLDTWPALKLRLARHLDHGRRLHTHTVRGYLQLRLAAGLRRWRRGNRRHAQESANLTAWLTAVQTALEVDYQVAVELLRSRRLVKGYSDTHVRGSGRFGAVLDAARRLTGRPDAAATVAGLRAAALRDAEGVALKAALIQAGLA